MDNGERARQSTLRTSLMICTLEIACARFVMRAAICSGEYATCVLPFLQLPTGTFVKVVFFMVDFWLGLKIHLTVAMQFSKDTSATSCIEQIVGEVSLPHVDGW
jgi:hypothetical protein